MRIESGAVNTNILLLNYSAFRVRKKQYKMWNPVLAELLNFLKSSFLSCLKWG